MNNKKAFAKKAEPLSWQWNVKSFCFWRTVPFKSNMWKLFFLVSLKASFLLSAGYGSGGYCAQTQNTELLDRSGRSGWYPWVLGSPSEGSQQVREMGKEEQSEILQRQMHSPASGEEQPQAAAEAGDALLESSSAEQDLRAGPSQRDPFWDSIHSIHSHVPLTLWDLTSCEWWRSALTMLLEACVCHWKSGIISSYFATTLSLDSFKYTKLKVSLKFPAVPARGVNAAKQHHPRHDL